MAESFYSILTKVGAAKIANAFALGTHVNITQFAVGDGNGAYYNPTDTQAALVHEVWRGAVQALNVDPQNPNWLVVEVVIPTTDGGFFIREAGIFDDAGDLIAIGKYPETYKPLVSDGSAKDLYVKMVIQVSNTASVTLKVDPSVVLATKNDVNALAGTGRTTETVKGASDAANAAGAVAATAAQSIATLQQEVDEHKADLASQATGKGASLVGINDPNDLLTATDTNGALLELAARPQKDLDNGRYQAQFGFDGTEAYNSCGLNNSTVTLYYPCAQTQDTGTNNLLSVFNNVSLSQQVGVGQKLLSAFLVNNQIDEISSVEVYLSSINGSANPDNLIVSIYDETTSTVLGSKSVLYSTLTAGQMNKITFDTPVGINKNNNIEIRLNVPSTGTSDGRYNFLSTTSDVQLNANLISTLNGWTTVTSDTAKDLRYKLNYNTKTTSGTVTKTITPSDLKKWGNLKWTQTATAAGSSVVCDVFDNGTSTTDVTPTMTSNTAPSGVVSASSTLAGKSPYYAFDKNSSTYWQANSNAPTEYIQYQYSTPKVMGGLSWTPDAGVDPGMGFKVQGSNDGVNFEDIFTPNCTPWAANTKQTFRNNGTLKPYSYFRFLTTTGNYLRASEIQIFEAVQLKSNITSIADLSDINITQYPSIQTRWTLTRLATTDASPTVSVPSVTWEGLGGDVGLRDETTRATYKLVVINGQPYLRVVSV